MDQKSTRTTSIGQIASQVLRRNPSALVSGMSSRGIYLQPEGDLSLYVTLEPYRGPLTLNIRGGWDSFNPIQTGDIAFLDDDLISFRDASLEIQIENPLIWKPGHPPSSRGHTASRATALASQVRKTFPEHAYLALLESVTSGQASPIPDLPGITDRIRQIVRSLKAGNPSDIISEMKLLLGVGPGLTPLGDDLLLGVLLAITRAKKQLFWTGDLVHFYHTVISAAEEKTTRVSWSLLSCAIQGSADERIIRVVDRLIAGREISTTDLENLLAWGSSSGIAVLAGMLLGLA